MKCITCGENDAINDFYKEYGSCIIEFERESEKSVEAETRMESSDNFKGSTRSDSRDSFHWKDMDHRDWYWKSIDIMDLSPEQRKHFRTIMRK